jgi:uncharacterized protein (TIGR02271 family)
MMTERSPYSGREIVGELGEIDLYANDGEKIGRILEVNPQFLVVERGGFLSGRSEFFIAREYVASESGDRWTLSVGKDELDSIGSDERPEMRADTQQGSTEERAASPRTTEGDRQTIQVHEEELEAQKVAREAGQVTITTDVVEETKTLEVPVTREEVRVERRAASDSTSGDVSADAFTGGTITVPVMEEQVQVNKVARAVEEIDISKVQTQDTKTVSDTVRKERVDIDDDRDATRRR